MNTDIPRSPGVLQTIFYSAKHGVRVWRHVAQQCLRVLSRRCHGVTLFAIPFTVRRLKL